MRKAKQATKRWARDEDKEQFWRNALIEYASSGVSISAFCRQRNIYPTSFNAWRRELQIRERERAASGSYAGESQVPLFPDRVKDSRGRVIPSRLSPWQRPRRKTCRCAAFDHINLQETRNKPGGIHQRCS
jgi:hypothetical protein